MDTIECRFCGEEIPAEAIKCGFCEKWLIGIAAGSSAARRRYSNGYEVWRFVALAVATFGIYEIIWFYRNWKHFKSHKNLTIIPILRTMGLFVPILGLYLVYSQLRDVRNVSEDAGITSLYSPGFVFLSWIIINFFWIAPDPLWMLSVISVIPLSKVQVTLNSYWEKEQEGLPKRKSFSRWQMAILLIGATIWFFTLVGTFMMG